MGNIFNILNRKEPETEEEHPIYGGSKDHFRIYLNTGGYWEARMEYDGNLQNHEELFNIMKQLFKTPVLAGDPVVSIDEHSSNWQAFTDEDEPTYFFDYGDIVDCPHCSVPCSHCSYDSDPKLNPQDS